MPHENSPLLPQSKGTRTVEYGLPMRTETSIYDRFTPGRKRMILALVSLAGMIPCEHFPLLTRICPWLTFSFFFYRERCIVFVIGSFVPCIPQISRDLDTTGTIIKQVFLSACDPCSHDLQLTWDRPTQTRSLAVSCYMVSGALGNLTWSTYAGFCELNIIFQFNPRKPYGLPVLRYYRRPSWRDVIHSSD